MVWYRTSGGVYSIDREAARKRTRTNALVIIKIILMEEKETIKDNSRQCEICKKEVPTEGVLKSGLPLKNSVVCSDRCSEIRQRLFNLQDKYFPTHGCDNCWGDLHQGCSEECKIERGSSFKFGKDLWDLIHLIYPR